MKIFLQAEMENLKQNVDNRQITAKHKCAEFWWFAVIPPIVQYFSTSPAVYLFPN